MEDVDEPLRLPPEKPVGELTWIAGGSVDECSVSLRFFGDDLDPQVVSKSLGVKPTHSCRKGDVFRGQVYDRIEKTGKWLFQVPKQADVELEDQINRLLDVLTSDLTIWRELTERYGSNLFCGLWLRKWNRELDFSPRTLQRLAERGLKLWLDIYFGPREAVEVQPVSE